MTKQQEEMEDLITTYLNGQASPEDAIRIHNWKSEAAENEVEFKQLEQIYCLVNRSAIFIEPNPDESWKWLKTKIQPPKRKTKLIYLIAATASVVAAACALVFVYVTTFNSHVVTAVKKQEKVNVTKMPQAEQIFLAENTPQNFKLIDGTNVRLEKGSKLILAKNYNQNKRNVLLIGSAKFSVIHNDKNPFFVHVQDLKIKDLGTVFSVISSSDTIRVNLKEGLVDLFSWSDKISLLPGESAFYCLKSKVVGKYEKPKKRERIFVFQNTRLKDAAKEIGDYFGAEINILGKNMEDCPLSVTFKNEDLGSILEIIKLIMDVEIKRNGTKIEIHGNACK